MDNLFKYLLTGASAAASYYVGKYINAEAAASAAGFVAALGAWLFHKMEPPAKAAK
jgi:hypothetical protein